MNLVNFLDLLPVAAMSTKAVQAPASLFFFGEIKGCPMCGKVHYRQKYCSVECRKIAAFGGSWKACKVCGTRTANKQTCSNACRAEYKKTYNAGLYQSKRNEAREYQRQYYQRVKDSDRHKAKQLRSSRALSKRKRESPKLRMESAIRARVMMSMKRRGTNKDGRTFELIGCTGAELAAHIEKQFNRGMSWDNYGSKWHVDHITPLSYFDMSNPDDQRRAWNWQNLRPLWALQNITEGNKRGECQTFLPLCN
jgi:predicted nucleic acid-binding Zn ribbon protein